MEALDCRLFDRAVHPLDLNVGPGMVRPLDLARQILSEPVLDAVRLADHVEAHLPRPGSFTIARLLSELDAIVGQDRVGPVRHRFQQVLKELPAVRLSASSTNWVTANLLVRSMPANR